MTPLSEVTDRDRLAADLASIRFGAKIEHPSQYEYDWADRLIALGWTRLDGGYDPLTADEMAELVREPMLVHLYDAHRLVEALVRRAALDEERLARALLRFDVTDYQTEPHGTELSPYQAAAAIAKAYREDTDASDA